MRLAWIGMLVVLGGCVSAGSKVPERFHTLLAPQASRTGLKQSCMGSQTWRQPIEFARLTLGTTPWCTNSMSTPIRVLVPPVES